MSSRMDRYRQRKERSALRGDYLYPMLVFAVHALGLTVKGLFFSGASLGWVWVAAGLVCASIGYGLFRCFEWARWSAALLLAASCLAALWVLVTDGLSAFEIVKVVVYAVFAIDLVLPATGRRFQVGRGEAQQVPNGEGT